MSKMDHVRRYLHTLVQRLRGTAATPQPRCYQTRMRIATPGYDALAQQVLSVPAPKSTDADGWHAGCKGVRRGPTMGEPVGIDRRYR